MRPLQAAKSLKNAMDAFDIAGDATGRAKAGIWLAKAMIRKEKFNDAVQLLEQSLGVLGRTAPESGEAVVGNTFLVYAYERLRESDKAAAHVLEVADTMPAVAMDNYQPLYGRQPVVRFSPATESGQASGKVTLEFTVAEDGTVRNAKVAESSSNAKFEQAALEAIATFRYMPQYENGSLRATDTVKFSFYWQEDSHKASDIHAPRPPHMTNNINSGRRFGMENIGR